MKIYYTYRAARQLAALPRFVQKRIAEKMRFFGEQNDPLEFAEPLTDYREGEYRFRIGNYRVTFDVAHGTIVVLKVGKRDQIY